ncbi:MAG: hypothetical protein ACKO2N_22010 [Tabrizicola sp.]
MSSVSKIVAEFAARPWEAIPEADLAACLKVPAMLRMGESQLYHWLGRNVQGDGAVIDLGAYAGGSAARLLSGLALSGRTCQLHAYDHFKSSRAVWAKWLKDEPVPDHDNADLLPLVRRHLAPWIDRVTLHPGEIANQRWTGGKIEILVVDAAKGSAIADHVAAEFYPALVPGRSVLVHQDYLMAVQPWLAAQMVALRDCFVPLAQVDSFCVAFLFVKAVDAASLEAARTNALTDGALMKQVREAAKWHDGMILRERFQAMLRQIKLNPGVRLGWKMRAAQTARKAEAERST